MRRRPTILTIVAATGAAAASSLLLAACGSNAHNPSSGSASRSGSQPSLAQMRQDGVDFSKCMRSHGVSDFPDAATRAFKAALNPSAPHSPAFQSAYARCRHLLPNDGVPSAKPTHSRAQIAAFVAFARCMRSHGFRSFPDPTSTGQLTHEMLASAGVDIHEPATVQAADTCAGVTHGFITRADVARFVAGH